MSKVKVWGTAFATVVVLALPFLGGGGPGLVSAAYAHEFASLTAAPGPARANEVVLEARAESAALAVLQDREHLAQKPVPTRMNPVGTAGVASGTLERRADYAAEGLSCPGPIGGSVTDIAPDIYTDLGVGGTTQDDLVEFATAFNTIRVENCLEPIPFANFTYDSCMEQRLFWMAEDPSEDPFSAWGHIGSVRSDGVPSVGCDGNLAGGTGNTGSTVAYKWWVSDSHRASLYKPGTSIDGVCIAFAMSHGGVPNEPYPFTRAAARWYDC
jgi:hypothetical protein